MITATANLIDVKALALKIETEANKVLRVRRQDLMDRIMETAQSLYAATTLYWEGGGNEPQITPGYVKKTIPEPKFEVPPPSETWDTIIQGIGTDNWLWIQLDKGIERIATDGEFYVPMTKPRTVPGTLTSSTLGGYTNELHRLTPGKPVVVPPRKWNDKIAESLREQYGPIAERQGLVLTVTVTDE